MTIISTPKNAAGEALVREKLDALLHEAFQRGNHGEFSLVLKVADGVFVEVRKVIDQGWRVKNDS